MPGSLYSRNIQARGTDFDLALTPYLCIAWSERESYPYIMFRAWVESGGSVQFESSVDQGAILVKKDKTFREDSVHLDPEWLRPYILQNFDSWLQFANATLRRGIKL
jgi:hypothetical protein